MIDPFSYRRGIAFARINFGGWPGIENGDGDSRPTEVPTEIGGKKLVEWQILALRTAGISRFMRLGDIAQKC